MQIQTLINSIHDGLNLTSQQCEALLQLIDPIKSRIRAELAKNVLQAMKQSRELQIRQDQNTVGVGFFPPVAARHYMKLIESYSSDGHKPDINAIESLLSDMKENEIPIDSKLANRVLRFYFKFKQYSRAAEFVDSVLVVGPSCSYVKNMMTLYRKVVENTQISRFPSSLLAKRSTQLCMTLRSLFQNQRSSSELDNNLLNEILLTLLMLNDEAAVLTVLQYYGTVLSRNINRDTVIVLKLQIQNTIVEETSRLKKEKGEDSLEVEQFNKLANTIVKECGLSSESFKTTMDLGDAAVPWRDAARIVLKYVACLNHGDSDANVVKRQQQFEERSLELQEYFDVPDVMPFDELLI
ncbi:unnamed protein product [Ambrosiozyma monospora]|uniref:Unnamed protein product n=1 Tax=Ambrosiozyma monospora TaxID=43982 RepID=A0ACB5TVV3_AMBMO|nr:unnamed protein product [Ambrosiozyma monospora]